MAGMTDRELAVIKSVFQRKGGPGKFSKLFSDFSKEDQQGVLSEAKLEPEELPILACIPGGGAWLLVTSSRLLHKSRDSLWSADHRDLKVVAADLRGSAVNRSPIGELSSVTLTTLSGERHSVTVESGAPYYGILNALQRLVISPAKPPESSA